MNNRAIRQPWIEDEPEGYEERHETQTEGRDAGLDRRRLSDCRRRERRERLLREAHALAKVSDPGVVARLTMPNCGISTASAALSGVSMWQR